MLKLNSVIAVTALVVAVFGSTPLGRAAQQLVLPKGSVGTAHLKKDAVTAAKVKNGTLVAADFKAGQLPAGPQGPKGDTGPPGPAGTAPEGTFTKAMPRMSQPVTHVAPGAVVDVKANCLVGEVATGGGFTSFSGMEIITNLPSIPVANNPATGWRVKVKNSTGVEHLFRVWVVCAS